MLGAATRRSFQLSGSISIAAMCHFRSIAPCELQAGGDDAQLSALHETEKTFLAALQYEASKGYINIKVCTRRETSSQVKLRVATMLGYSRSITSEDTGDRKMLVFPDG